jgi:inosose dehydratase
VSRSAQVATRPAVSRRRIRTEPAASGRIGIVPIVWNNADLADLAPPVPATTVLDEIARLGYSGTQLGIGFPRGRELVAELASRGLRLAEVYVALPCDRSGPGAGAEELARAALDELHSAGGDVLVVALGLSAERDTWVGRAGGAPTLTDAGWRSLGAVLDQLGAEAAALRHTLAFHNHAATYVETPEEVDRLAEMTAPGRVGLCIDVGHATLGGGDPAAMIRRHGNRVAHVHLKDVAPGPLDELRNSRLTGFEAALRARIFAPLGGGVLDLPSVLESLASAGYRGWLMVEQDTSWEPPSEAAAIGRRVLESVLRWSAPAMGGRR